MQGVLGIDSPGGRYQLILDELGGAVYDFNGRVERAGDADQAAVLVDRARGISRRIAFCGTGCGFDWGCWIDSTQFALAGVANDAYTSDGTQGFLRLYTIPDSTMAVYSTGRVSEGAWERYNGGVEAWLTARYRAWERSGSGR